MDMLRTGCVDVKMLPPEWRHRIVDVCGVGPFKRTELRDVFVTHTHLDHLLLKEYVHGARLRFFTAKKYLPEITGKYGDIFEVCEYRDVAEVHHTTRHGNRFVSVASFVYFIKDAVIIPESDNPGELIREYAPRFAFTFVSRQSHLHPVSFNNRRRDIFILDNAVWRPYAPNIIPKIAFSCSKEDRELYRRFHVKTDV